MRHGIWENRGLRLAWREAGAGLPILFLHAFPLSGAQWDPQVAALAGRYRCIVPDLAGFGASQVPPADGVTRMSDLAGDAVALLDHLGIARAVVAGLSMGGYAALALAERSPARLLALVLADTKAGADSEEARQGRLDAARRVLAEGSGALLALVPKLLGAEARKGESGLRSWVEEQVAAAPPQGVAAAQRGMAARPDRTPLLHGIRTPALILVGDEDAITPPAEAQRLLEAIPGAELVTLKGAGHLSNLERPEDFNRALEAFLLKL